MSNVGKELKVTGTQPKLAVAKSAERKVSPTTKPDQFGQVRSGEKDLSGDDIPSAADVNRQHGNADTDVSSRSQHHTLGTGRTQASPGNHIHDGISSPKLGALAMSSSGNTTVPALTLTGAKGGNVALTNLIAMLGNFINFTDSTT